MITENQTDIIYLDIRKVFDGIYHGLGFQGKLPRRLPHKYPEHNIHINM